MTDLPEMNSAVGIIQALAWPAVAAGALWAFHAPLAELLAVTGRKIERGSVKLTVGDLALEIAEESLRAGITQTAPTATANGGIAETPRDEFRRLTGEYANLRTTVRDPQLRLATRHRLADRLGALVVELSLPRRQIAAGDEGERVALATAAVLRPEPDDLAALLVAAGRPSGPFTGYRTLLAIIPSLARARVRKRVLETAGKVVDGVEINANPDPALRRQIERVRALIEAA